MLAGLALAAPPRCAAALNSALHAPPNLLDASVLSLGDPSVNAPLFSKLQRCEPITVVSLGSSITARRGGCTHMLGNDKVEGCCGTSCAGPRGWRCSFSLFFSVRESKRGARSG